MIQNIVKMSLKGWKLILNSHTAEEIIYYIGIYHVCLGIHEGLEFLHEEIQKQKQNRDDHRKGSIGIQSTPAKKPMKKIGFEIPQA